MDNQDWQYWKDNSLFPALYEHIDQAFPEMEFKETSKGWISKHHLNGERDRQGDNITYIYPNSKFMAVDHARGKKGLVDLFMSLNNTDYKDAEKRLADICNLEVPQTDPAQREKYIKQQQQRETADNAFVKALWGGSDNAFKVLSYLHNRRWTDGEIKEAGLGLADTATISQLDTETQEQLNVSFPSANGKSYGIGTTNILAIPFRNGSSITGFKFRNLLSKAESKAEFGKDTRYLFSKGTKKANGFFGLTANIKDIVIVEGELDALHAQVKGATNVVATTGNQAADGQIEDAVKRGVKKFTLLFDNDERGRAFITPTIEGIIKADKGSEIYVAFLPDGTKAKDLDEYLCTHSIEEFNKEVVGKAESYSIFLLQDITQKYIEREKKEGELSQKCRADFFTDFGQLYYSKVTSYLDRQLLLDYTQEIGYDKALRFDINDLRLYLKEQQLKKEANADLGKLEEDLTRDLSPLTPETLKAKMALEGGELKTGYFFENSATHEKSELTLPEKAVTFVAAPTSHGKSTMLINLALRVLESNPKEKVLYISYEETDTATIAKFISVLTAQKGTSEPIFTKTIKDELAGKDSFISRLSSSDQKKYIEAKQDFFKMLADHRLLIVYKEYSTNLLIRYIKAMEANAKISTVFLDYVQLLHDEDGARRSRQEELKGICDKLRALAVSPDFGLPLIMAAQFNRQVTSPLSMLITSLGEAGDLERAANTVVGMWNCGFPITKSQTEIKGKYEDEYFALKGLDNGEKQPNKIYCKILKRRGGEPNVKALFDFDGATGLIGGTMAEQSSAPQEQSEDFLTFHGDKDLPFIESDDEKPF